MAQEILLPLTANPKQFDEGTIENIDKVYELDYIPVDLDESKTIIIDDFSYDYHKPVERYWEKSGVYVNSSYARNPTSIGVATFDGLNFRGYPYDFDEPTSYGSCDTLTSKEIRLGNVDATDPKNKIYLSFSYQPQGRNPFENDERDSLFLEFNAVKYVTDTVELSHSTTDTTIVIKDVIRRKVDNWVWVWGIKGSGYYQDVDSSPIFNRAVIPLDASYYRDGFQFRFRNFGNTSGNLDVWHLDNVIFSADSIQVHQNFNDVAYRLETGSKLKNYESMPWFHYYTNPTSFVDDANLDIKVYNAFDIPIVILLDYEAYDETGSQVDNLSSTISGTTLDPNSSESISLPISGSHDFKFPIDNLPLYTTTYFKKINTFQTDNPTLDKFKGNNTMAEYQIFGSYYAYDDGTAEAGYGVKTSNGGCVAQRFDLPENIFDTLTAAYIYFNPVVVNRQKEKYKLTVWDDVDGHPGSVLSQNLNIDIPQYPKKGENYFVRVPLTNPVALSGTFYIGYEKTTDEVLNIGYDVNRDSREKMFFSVDGSCASNPQALWLNSNTSGSVKQPGALMIRPAFKYLNEPIVGVKPERKKSRSSVELDLFPNPARYQITVSIGNQDNNASFLCRIYSLEGKMLKQQILNSTAVIDVQDLRDGMYILTVTNNASGKTLNNKFVIRK